MNEPNTHPQPPSTMGLITSILPPMCFWRKEPLNPSEQKLIGALIAAHERISRRESICLQALRMTACGSGTYANAIAAATLAIGGPATPIGSAMDFIMDPDAANYAPGMITSGATIPGWGLSPHEGPDPDLAEVHATLKETNPILARKIDGITEAIHSAGEAIFPNETAFTAAVAVAVKMPAKFTPFLIYVARLGAWTEQVFDLLHPEVRE